MRVSVTNVSVAVTAMVGLGIAYFSAHHLPLPPCMFWKITGLYCPGCGSTRALLALMHGHPLTAVAWNPLLACAIPLMFAHRWGNVRVQQWLGWGMLTLLIMFVVARNLPWWPFWLLAPGGMLH